MKDQDFHTKIEETLNSLDGIQRAQANPFLLTRVLEKMQAGTHNLVKPSLVWQTVVSLVIIVGLNVAIGLYTSSTSVKPVNTGETGYFSNHMYNY